MKGNARKYLSLMLTASMVLGSFGTTAFAANTATTDYISIAAAYAGNGTTSPAGLKIASEKAATLETTTTTSAINIVEESTNKYTLIHVGGTTNNPIAYTSSGATEGAAIDFTGADFTVKSNTANVNMTGGKIGTLKFEAPAARTFSARAAVAGNSFTISGGQTTGDIVGAEEVKVDGGTVANINDAKNVTVTNGTVGAVNASDVVTISNGTVSGTVSAKTAAISGGTVNNTVTATEKVEISGTNTQVKSVSAPEVAISGTSKVTDTITGANITVEKDATVKNIVVNDKNAVVDIKGTLASGATITVDPSIANDIESLEVTIPTGSAVKVPEEATKVEEKDASGKVTSFQVAVNYYEKKSDTNATSESGLITGSIAADTTKSITLANKLNNTAFTGDWHSNLTDKDGKEVASTATKAGDSFVVLDTYATPLNFYSVDDSGTPSTKVDVKFEYYVNATTTGSATVSFANASAAKFPEYSNTGLGKSNVATPENQEFDGWGIGDKTTTVIGRKGDTITNLTATYVPVFKAKGTNPSGDKIKVELYRINSDTKAQKTVELDYTLVNGNKVFKAPANEFSYSGKTFDSWSTNFDKAYYYPGKNVTVPAGTAEPVKLYAYWTNKSSSGGGGGGGSSSSSTKYTVTASAGKGGSISPSGDVQVTKGNDKTFKITADKGYVISDVLVDGDSVGAVRTYTIKNIKNDMTIKAVFETEDGKPAEEDPENPSEDPSENKGTFTDTRGHWAEKYINTVVEKGLFSGMTDTTFGPDVAMTRAMFVTVLGRMSNVNTTSYSSSKFSDVPADSWFGPYVNWAAQQGIVSGLTSTTFGPNDPITREQMAVILVNYAKVAGVVLPTVNDPMMFSDNSNISGWAKDAVATAQKAGLINGRTNGSFDPQGKATRAEVATVFVQLDSLTGGSKAAATDTAAEETETTETEETTEE